MTDGPSTPREVVIQLVALSRELQSAMAALKHAGMDKALKHRAAKLARARAYMKAEGTIPEREHAALLATEYEDDQYAVSNAVVQGLRGDIETIKQRIEMGRSMGATLRTEMSMLPYDPAP